MPSNGSQIKSNQNLLCQVQDPQNTQTHATHTGTHETKRCRKKITKWASQPYSSAIGEAIADAGIPEPMMLCVEAGPIARTEDFKYLGGWLRSPADDFQRRLHGSSSLASTQLYVAAMEVSYTEPEL